MIRTALRNIVTALALLPIAAQADPSSSDDVLIAAFEAGACQLTTDELDVAFLDAGLSRQDSTEAIINLTNRGEIVFSADGERAYLTSGTACADFAAPEIEVDPNALVALVGLFEDNNCALPMAAASLDPLRPDFSDASIEAATASLIADKALSFESGVSTLTVGAVCGAKVR